ncbi:hypothetical protein [Embleya sp. NBC_00896]|uniref:hypothetical protein n=1 Tax=Embleya sp. NBC_00896 TaxID=2975961 RepID=UPI002F90FA2A|nr:hypothetical protein OG928_43525 [Embleya sp. NBC_00896]
MSATVSRRARRATVVATGALAVLAAFPVAAYAAGPASENPPIQGRTEGGSIILTSGDIVACAGVNDLRIAGADGREHLTNGPGTHFTTPAGTDVLTLRTGVVRATVKGASVDIQCGPEEFPTVVKLADTGPGDELAPLAAVGLGLIAAGGVAVAATRRPRRRPVGA